MSEQKQIFIRWFSLWVILEVCLLTFKQTKKFLEIIYLPYIVERLAGIARLLLSCAMFCVEFRRKLLTKNVKNLRMKSEKQTIFHLVAVETLKISQETKHSNGELQDVYYYFQ